MRPDILQIIPQNSASENKDVYDSTGTQCALYVPAAGQPGNLKGTMQPYTCPTFSTTFAAQYHTYKLIWTPGWLAWAIDGVVYRNTTASPWRPVTMRPLLRTNVGTAASVQALPDANVYVRRIRYTPLTFSTATQAFLPAYADPVVRNALSCTSMASCFGSMQSSAAGLMQLTTGSAAAASPAGRRRQLLQSAAPALMCSGSNCSAAVIAPPTNLTAYQQELAQATLMAQAAVAGTLVDGNVTVLPSQVSVAVNGHTLNGVMWLYGIPFSFWNAQLQNAFVSGLAADVLPTPDQVYVTGTADASLLSSWCSWGASNANPQICSIASTYDMPYPNGAACPQVSYPNTAVTSTEEYPNLIGSCTASPCPAWATSGGTTYCNKNYSVRTNIFTSTCSGMTQASCPVPPAGAVFAGTGTGGAYVTINPLQGILVSWTVDGYNCALVPGSASTCNDGGYTYAQQDLVVVNEIQSGTVRCDHAVTHVAPLTPLLLTGWCGRQQCVHGHVLGAPAERHPRVSARVLRRVRREPGHAGQRGWARHQRGREREHQRAVRRPDRGDGCQQQPHGCAGGHVQQRAQLVRSPGFSPLRRCGRLLTCPGVRVLSSGAPSTAHSAAT